MVFLSSSFVFILLLPFAPFFLLPMASVSHAEDDQTISIMILGDSITAGYGLKTDEVLTQRLQTKFDEASTPVTIINAGVSGDTTSGGRARLDWMIKQHSPDIVLIELGGNDALRGVPPAVAKENLTVMIQTLQKNDIKTILSAVNAPPNMGPDYVGEFDAIYPDLAEKYDIDLYPFFLESIFATPGMMQSDRIHPTAAGAKVIADELYDYLTNYLSKEKQ